MLVARTALQGVPDWLKLAYKGALWDLSPLPFAQPADWGQVLVFGVSAG